MPLDIKHVSLAELLSHSRPFHMARYQRHYEWARKEMEQLLDDLADAYHDHQKAPAAGAFHFLGNIILFDNPLGVLEVVDGQQRLTSLTLLLAAAREQFATAGMRDELARKLFIAGDGAGAQARLVLHRGDQQFLRDVILDGTTTAALEALGKQDHPGNECLRTNALIARTWLAAQPASALTPFMRFILAQGRFVEIQVGHEDDAFRIFETVNNRGRGISSEDVLRYALVEYATHDPAQREAYLQQWDAMESALGPRGMKRFIGAWRGRVTKGARPRQALHRIVLDSFTSPEEARAFLDSQFSGDVSTFRQIETGDIALAEGPVKQRIDTILRSLALVDFDEWLPIAAELVDRSGGEADRLAADLARLERLCWYYYLNRDDKGVYQDRRDHFAALMKLVSEAGTFAALPSRALLGAEQRAKMRDIVQQRLDPKWIPLRSLLVRLEMALADDGIGVTRESVTIEHVLPVRPTAKGWLAPYDNNLKVVTEYAERIGNLCLVSPELNSQLGNRIYSAKRELMRKDGVTARSKLAADIAKEAAWTREVITRRSTWLLKVFCDALDVHAHRR